MILSGILATKRYKETQECRKAMVDTVLRWFMCISLNGKKLVSGCNKVRRLEMEWMNPARLFDKLTCRCGII